MQSPQWVGSFKRSTHVVLHGVSPQRHEPFMQGGDVSMATSAEAEASPAASFRELSETAPSGARARRSMTPSEPHPARTSTIHQHARPNVIVVAAPVGSRQKIR